LNELTAVSTESIGGPEFRCDADGYTFGVSRSVPAEEQLGERAAAKHAAVHLFEHFGRSQWRRDGSSLGAGTFRGSEALGHGFSSKKITGLYPTSDFALIKLDCHNGKLG
jgi:hypothetical protein